jgi:4-carboxymuconolactone decarboxylase
MAQHDRFKAAVPTPEGQAMHQAIFGKPNDEPLVGLREFTLNHLFANIWGRSRDPLDPQKMISLRERSIITVALLAAQGREVELRKHIGGARHQGLSKEQILEIMIHVAHYAGWPAGNSGQRVALEEFAKDAGP